MESRGVCNSYIVTIKILYTIARQGIAVGGFPVLYNIIVIATIVYAIEIILHHTLGW